MRHHSRSFTVLVALLALFVVTCPADGQAPTTQLFGQCAVGGGATTMFTVHNPGATPLEISIEMLQSTGVSFYETQVTLGPLETRNLTYGGAAGTLTVGWARLSAPSEFVATVLFKIAYLGNVGVLPGELTTEMKLFGFTGPKTRTGVAIANPSDTASSNLTARIFDLLGQFQGQTSFTLAPLHHGAVYLDEPPFNMSADGMVELTATQPVVAMTLRQDNDLLSGAPVVTSSAAAITGYERVSHTEEFSGLTGSHAAQVSCPAGKKALGGSAYIDWLFAGDRPLVNLEDYPLNDTTWSATFSNYNDHAVNGAFRVVVICAKCQ